MKKVVPINESWLFNRGFNRACLESDYDFGSFYPVSLPHNAFEEGEDYADSKHQGVNTYTRLLLLDEKYNGSKLTLCFDGALSYTEVYVNGMFVTSHKGETPFTADVTAPVKYGYENRIVLKVDGRVKKDVPAPSGGGPMLCYGGVHREVWLSIVSGGEICDAFVEAESVSGLSCAVKISVTLGDFYPDSFLSADIFDGKDKRVASFAPKAVLSREVTLTGTVEEPQLWSPENPALYTAVVTLKSGEKAADVEKVTFGLRKAEFKPSGFYLNGKKLKLIGLNRMDCFPIIGRAAGRHLQRTDARILKEKLGCNAVRLHGLSGRYFLEECARIGLMVIEDVSGEGFVGESSWREAFVKNIEDTVKRDRNNPAVIAWGVRVNNSADCDELYFKANKAARDNDPTRPTFGARSFMGSRLYEDVFAYNDYPKGASTLSRLGKTSKLFVPYFISEHTGKTYPVKNFDTEYMRNEQARRHLAVIDKVSGHKRISGCTGMAFADFNCLKDGGSGDSVYHYGVMDGYRNEKTAAYAYRALGECPPFLEPSSSLKQDDFTGTLTLYTNCDSVKLYRDDCLIGEYYPARRKYKNLKHPPVEITDLIGDLPQANDKLTAFQSSLLKYVAKAAALRGGLMNLGFFQRTAAALLSRMLKADSATFSKLVEKYSSHKGEYRADGIIGGEVAVSRNITSAAPNRLVLDTAAKLIEPSSSYETVLISIKSTDGAGNILNYDFSPLNIEVEGELRLLGEDTVSLKGGRTGIFLVTTPYDGKAVVSVKSRWGRESIELEVRHERVEKL